MSRSSWFIAAGCASALALGACAGGASTDTSASTSSSLTAPPAESSTSTAPQTAQSAAPQTTAPAQPASYTDDQLRHFAAAALEIQPITQQLPTATPEQRTAAADQIRAILTRHNLDGATYNAIASQAQADPAFAARIAALNQASTTPQGE
jgi:hypothetical protein